MGNSTAITQGGWMLRFVSRRIPTCVAFVAHIAVLFALVYDPTVKLVIGEQPGPTLVEIVVVPPHGSTVVEGGEVAEPTSTAIAALPLPTFAEKPPPEISERGETIDKPVTLAGTGSKAGGGCQGERTSRSASPKLRAASCER